MNSQIKPLSSKGKGTNPNSLANLVKGRARLVEKRKNGELSNPQGYSLKAELKHALKERRHELIEATIQGAIELQPTPFHEVWDRVEGPVKDTRVENQDNRVLNVIVLNTETKDLIGKLAGWTVKPQVGRDATEQT